MNNYSIVAMTEEAKYQFIEAIRRAGATLTGVSGYGSGYYIQLDATPDQVELINTALKEILA